MAKIEETDENGVLDPRSTYRKRARRILLARVAAGELEYRCVECKYVPEIPWNVPSRSGDILDADHKNKIWSDLDPANLQWLCRPCHYAKDRSTPKGVSPVGETYGYDYDGYGMEGYAN